MTNLSKMLRWAVGLFVVLFLALWASGPTPVSMGPYAQNVTSTSAEVCAFSSDLPQLMRKADLVISRSGGTTLSELAVLGVPAVLVPYPYHRDQHQLLNARAYADAGAAVVVDEKDLDAVHLGSLFEEILVSPGRLRKMAESARGRGRPDAADLVLDLAVELNETCRTASVSFS